MAGRGWIGRFYRSTVGRKIVMAVTGAILVGFVIGHMTGNLLVFKGPDAINSYSRFLHSTGELLWAVRAVLLVSVVLHVHSAFSLTRAARAARPADYAEREGQVTTLSARSMRWGGVLLLLFVIFHLLHFTTGTLHPFFVPGDVYANVVVGFSVPAVVAFYLVAMAALALHLHHGVASLFQTLGASHPHWNPGRRRLATLLAVVVPVGFAAVPVAVVLRFLW
jgi:succinate dehydrogenase / fumarate reductase cytochrome b subunit